MDISGSQKITASREKVFNALLDPTIIKNSLPGCSDAEYVDLPEGRQLKLVITTSIPGFKGPYNVFLEPKDLVPSSHMVLSTEPYNDFGSIKAVCAVDLSEEPTGTGLVYKAQAEPSGKIASVPEMIIKPAIKNTLEKFFSNFEKQVSGS